MTPEGRRPLLYSSGQPSLADSPLRKHPHSSGYSPSHGMVQHRQRERGLSGEATVNHPRAASPLSPSIPFR